MIAEQTIMFLGVAVARYEGIVNQKDAEISRLEAEIKRLTGELEKIGKEGDSELPSADEKKSARRTRGANS